MLHICSVFITEKQYLQHLMKIWDMYESFLQEHTFIKYVPFTTPKGTHTNLILI